MSTTIHDAQTSHVYRFMCNFQLASSDSAQQDLQALSAKQDTLISTRTMRSIGIVEYLTMLQACARLRPNLMFSATGCFAILVYYHRPSQRPFSRSSPAGTPCASSLVPEYRLGATSFFSSFKLPTVNSEEPLATSSAR